MNIGEASKASGVSAKMIRHYESIGLMPEASRTDAGYRLYDESSVHTLRFIRRARDLGFEVPEIRELLGLWVDRSRRSSQVKKLALGHVGRLEEKIRELRAMADTLKHLAGCCHGDHRPECPILDDLAR